MKRHDIGRWIATGLSVILLSGCGGPSVASEENKGKDEQVSLYDRGLKLMAKMDTMAESEDYVGLMVSSPDVLAVVKEIGDENYTEPKAVYEIKISEDTAKSLLNYYGGEIDSLPEELQRDLKHRLVAAVPTMLSAVEGTDILAAVSLIRADDYFIDNSFTEDTIYIYIYDSRCCGAVVFSAHNDGIVSAAGSMIISEIPGKAGDVKEIEEWLMQNAGLLGIQISEVSP